MGQVNSTTGEEEAPDYFAVFEGLEEQLEASFLMCDMGEEGSLPYDVLEPVLRHHLMQCGLLEYVSRFAHNDGSLSLVLVNDELDELKCDIKRGYLDIDAWKLLVVAWIVKVRKTQESDVATWEKTMKDLQEKQAEEYQESMKMFQKSYVKSLEQYYKEVEARHKEEEEFRKEWEASQQMQDEFYTTQMQFLELQNEAQQTQWEQIQLHKRSLQNEYLKQLGKQQIMETGDRGVKKIISAVSFAYPQYVTDVGAPVSAGSPAPRRRRRRA